MSALPNEAFTSSPQPNASIRRCGRHDCELLRTHTEQPHNPSMCDRFARPDPPRRRTHGSRLVPAQCRLKNALERDDFLRIVVPALSFCLSMIFPENRCPLFRIML